MKSFNRKLVQVCAALGITVAEALQMAHATGIDTTAALAGVTDAQTAILALVGGLIGLSAAIFGVVKVYGFLKKRAGA
jgi:hypothetical protein